MSTTKRICLWSGPRNISTALMYAFAQRKDTKVFDEPLYGHYLKHHPEARQYHPGADEIMYSMPCEGKEVVEMMLDSNDKPVLFFKHMTHHLLHIDRSFMAQTVNIILTRNPEEMLPSFHKVIHNPSLDDVGYAMHLELLDHFKTNHIPFTVLDSKRVLINPKETLSKLCEFIGIPFDNAMLAWENKPLIEDGIWAKYWYKSVHQSEGFLPYKKKSIQLEEELKPLLKQCLPYYRRLLSYAI